MSEIQWYQYVFAVIGFIAVPVFMGYQVGFPKSLDESQIKCISAVLNGGEGDE